jgi:hypothetical protein
MMKNMHPPPISVLLIGRHAPDFGAEPIVLAEQRNVTFPATAQACISVIRQLLGDAHALSAALVFQAMPSQVAVALVRMASQSEMPDGWSHNVAVGVLINRPAARPAGVTHQISLPTHAIAQTVVETLRKVNPNAVIELDDAQVSIVVDPPMKFEFSHIEWV